jgi:hypothetical protein
MVLAVVLASDWNLLGEFSHRISLWYVSIQRNVLHEAHIEFHFDTCRSNVMLYMKLKPKFITFVKICLIVKESKVVPVINLATHHEDVSLA